MELLPLIDATTETPFLGVPGYHIETDDQGGLMSGTHGSFLIENGAMEELTTLSSLLPMAGNMSGNMSGSNATHGPMYKFYQKEQIGFLVFILIAIVVGNLAVLVAIGVSKRGSKSRMTFFIMHLAIADLSVGLVSVLPDLVWRITMEWYAGDAMCKIVKFIQAVVLYGSTYVLVSLSIDRLDAIARPLSFSSSRLRAKGLVIAAWVLSCLFSVPMLFLCKEQVRASGKRQCIIDLKGALQWQIYLVLLASVLFFIPMIIIAVCYYAMIHVIWSKSRTLTTSYSGSPGPKASILKRFSSKKIRTGLNKDEKEHLDKSSKQSCSSSRGVIPQAKIRTVKMTFVIVLVFIVCWSPFFVFNLLDVFGKIASNQRTVSFRVLVQSFAPLNSVFNPLIYGIFSSRICSHLRNIRWINWLMNKICCCCTPAGSRHERAGSMYSSTVQSYADDYNRKMSRTSSNGAVRYHSYHAAYRKQDSSDLLPSNIMMKDLG